MKFKDGKNRCKWCNQKNDLYIKYHDEEWGVPNFEEKYLFEMLILESFQAGLSWECVLNKREEFKKAFDNFDINKIIQYDEKKIKELINNEKIIRNKLKIKAAINNAKIFKNIQKKYKTFYNYLATYTGGKSYPVTGSTGDGYRIAKDLGHTITKIEPSLVPLTSHDEVCKKLQGLSLRNVAIQLQICDKVVYKDFGEMLFTHFGVSGPIVLSASSYLVKTKNIEQILKGGKVELEIDLKPALSEEKLDARILRDFEEQKNKQFKNSLDKLLPQKLIPIIIEKSKINPNKKVNEIKKEERKELDKK